MTVNFKTKYVHDSLIRKSLFRVSNTIFCHHVMGMIRDFVSIPKVTKRMHCYTFDVYAYTFAKSHDTVEA